VINDSISFEKLVVFKLSGRESLSSEFSGFLERFSGPYHPGFIFGVLDLPLSRLDKMDMSLSLLCDFSLIGLGFFKSIHENSFVSVAILAPEHSKASEKVWVLLDSSYVGIQQRQAPGSKGSFDMNDSNYEKGFMGQMGMARDGREENLLAKPFI
jgi:hypothetical protein